MKMLPDSFTVTLTDADYQRAVTALRNGFERSECCLVSQAVRRRLHADTVETGPEWTEVGGVVYQDGPSLVDIVDWFDDATRLAKPKSDWPKTLPKRWQKKLTFRKEVA